MTDSLIQVISTPEFLRNIKALNKKYRNIAKNIQPVIAQLESGEIIGDQIPNIGYSVFKIRIKNNDVQKGKSSGYRLIYFLKTENNIILLTIYTKSEQSDIAANKLRDVIFAYDRQDVETSDSLITSYGSQSATAADPEDPPSEMN